MESMSPEKGSFDASFSVELKCLFLVSKQNCFRKTITTISGYIAPISIHQIELK